MTIVDQVRAQVARWQKATPGPKPLPETYWQSGSSAVPWFSGFDDNWQNQLAGMNPAEMYRSQPYLRLVVDFLARNIAQLGLQVFDRFDDDRQRVTVGPIAQTLARPNPSVTLYELVRDLVSDLALYDKAYWLTSVAPDAVSGWEIYQLPAPWVTPLGGNRYQPAAYRYLDLDGEATTVPAANVLAFHGWSPGHVGRGLSPVETLKGILGEQLEAHKFRSQLWKRNGRVNSFLTRPAAAPQWSDTAEAQFKEDWKASWTGNGGESGGTPILQDGMEIKRVGFSAKEDEFVDASKLALTTVASVYHINPTMIGILDSANYSNVREFRRMLYGDTLGPIMAMIESRVNTFLLPRLAEPPVRYVEFNIGEKLQGSFEEQAAVMSTLVGAPVFTPNEGRAKFNLPAIEGGDVLMLSAAQLVAPPADDNNPPAPSDGAAAATLLEKILGRRLEPVPVRQAESKRVARKHTTRAGAAPEWVAKASETALAATFARQQVKVLAMLGGNGKARRKAAGDDDPDWWDSDRWDGELGDDLLQVATDTAAQLGPAHAKELGYSPDDFDMDRLANFLTAVTASRARWINSTTKAAVQDALDNATDGEVVAPVKGAFDYAIAVRAALTAITLANTFSNISANEAAQQLAPAGTATKTWVVTSSNPRPEHDAMDGETVACETEFSNGAQWPGDPVLGAEGVAGCTCVVDISREAS